MMVTRQMYKKYNEKWWKGRKVITRVTMRNHYTEIPKGTVCEIHGKQGGFTLKTEPCKCCGISIFIRKVPPEEISLML